MKIINREKKQRKTKKTVFFFKKMEREKNREKREREIEKKEDVRLREKKMTRNGEDGSSYNVVA